MGVNIILGVIIVLLLMMSAFVSASETAFFSLGPKDMEELGSSDSKRDAIVTHLCADTPRLLATILIANNLVNVAIVVLTATLMTRLFDFSGNPLLSFLVETMLITFLLLLFGENLPKIYATSNNLKFARHAAYPMRAFEVLLYPLSLLLIKPLSHITHKGEKHGSAITMDEIEQAFEATQDNIKEDKELLEGIIRFGDVNAAAAMTPRVDVIAIEDTASFVNVIRTINKNEYSRMPIYHDDLDNITGILYIKDLLPHLGEPEFKWQTIVRKAHFVPETKHINELLEEFQKTKTHIAIVVDEFGGTAGIITMEDILEEIVGDIDDEYDDADKNYARINASNYLFEAKIPLGDFFRITDIDSEEFEKDAGEAETLGGFILELQGEIPVQETEIDYKSYRFKIVSADKRRIKTIKFTILNPDAKSE